VTPNSPDSKASATPTPTGCFADSGKLRCIATSGWHGQYDGFGCPSAAVSQWRWQKLMPPVFLSSCELSWFLEQALNWALYGGEDFELVLCLPQSQRIC